MADISDNSTASNYSIQPGSNHPPIPDPIDVRDHDARDMPDMPWGASTSDAATGLGIAKASNKPSSKYQGNNQIQTRATMSAYSKALKN